MPDNLPQHDNTTPFELPPAVAPGYDPVAFAMPPIPPAPATSFERRPSSVTQAVMLFAATVIGFLGGASLVAALWIATTSSRQDTYRQPSRGNRPDAVIAAKPLAPNTLPSNASPKRTLSAEDLAFGEKQVERMAKDRPEMLRYVRKGDAVWRYCARAFGGASIGERVYWDSTPPQSTDSPAEHMGPYMGSSGYIRVRAEYVSGFDNGTKLTCEELWSSAVFELENIKGTAGFNRLYEMALQGKLTREQWIRENTRLEYEACRRTGELYRTLWVPMAQARGVPSTASEWFANVPSTYEEWIAGYDDPNSYPWNDTGRYWDEEVQPYLRRTRNR